MSTRHSLTRPVEIRNEELQASPMASPTNSTFSAGSSGRTSFQSHARTMSIAAADAAVPTVRSNRFSLQFPIQPSLASSPVRTSVSPVRNVADFAEPVTVPVGPTDGNFLTAIAAQERRVLEIKEELQRAEAELDKLKAQWAQHESRKKRDNAKSITKLQPLHSLGMGAEDEDGAAARAQQEIERRKALLASSKTSSRTVFSGSRHTRALSLLAPRDGVAPAARSRPERESSLKYAPKPDGQGSDVTTKALTRASTMPQLPNEDGEVIASNTELSENNVDHELLFRTGKKMAADLRDGLYTFWEDLRQATVGEETEQIPPPKRKTSTQALLSARGRGSRTNLRPSSRGSSVASKASTAEPQRASPTRKPKPTALPDLANPSFFSEHGAQSVQASPAPKKTHMTPRHQKSISKTILPVESDAWDTWDDSPEQSRSSSAASEANTVPSTIGSSPVSKELDETPRQDPIPWPVLTKLGPAQLKRTASHLMREWERTLTPSPGREWQGEDYLDSNAGTLVQDGSDSSGGKTRLD